MTWIKNDSALVHHGNKGQKLARHKPQYSENIFQKNIHKFTSAQFCSTFSLQFMIHDPCHTVFFYIIEYIWESRNKLSFNHKILILFILHHAQCLHAPARIYDYALRKWKWILRNRDIYMHWEWMLLSQHLIADFRWPLVKL